MSKQTVYIENSIVSYLTTPPTLQIVAAARQQLTKDWWESCRQNFQLYTSELVLFEASRGNPDAAKRRIKSLDSMPLLTINKYPEICTPQELMGEKNGQDYF